MADTNRKPTVKRSIKPVTITLTVEASRVNENGTFSALVLKDIKGPNGTITAAFPPMGGGSIYLKVTDLKGLTILEEGEKADKVAKKLF